MSEISCVVCGNPAVEGVSLEDYEMDESPVKLLLSWQAGGAGSLSSLLKNPSVHTIVVKGLLLPGFLEFTDFDPSSDDYKMACKAIQVNMIKRSVSGAKSMNIDMEYILPCQHTMGQL
jgi:hypothetical protein